MSALVGLILSLSRTLCSLTCFLFSFASGKYGDLKSLPNAEYAHAPYAVLLLSAPVRILRLLGSTRQFRDKCIPFRIRIATRPCPMQDYAHVLRVHPPHVGLTQDGTRPSYFHCKMNFLGS